MSVERGVEAFCVTSLRPVVAGLVAALSREWGWYRKDGEHGVTVWAELARPGRRR
ncbi:hypothetical protein GCM10027294_52870 [Marinactinospora endophytica]